jgi:hypothetical protein
MESQVKEALALALLATTGVAMGQELEVTPWPQSERECEAAYERNVALENVLYAQMRKCSNECLNRILSTDNRNACGEESTDSDGTWHLYAACRPIKLQWQRVLNGRSPERDACLARVAAKQVWKASSQDPPSGSVPAYIQDTTTKIGEKVKAGNPAVDYYRDESQRRAKNAATTLQSQGITTLHRQMSTIGEPGGSSSAPAAPPPASATKKRAMPKGASIGLECFSVSDVRERTECMNEALRKRQEKK